MHIRVKTPAKLNLSFKILGLRDDGYHDVETVFQSISLEDELSFEFKKSDQEQLVLGCDNPYLRKLMPLDQSNLIAKAMKVYRAKINESSSLSINVQIDKKIPIGAGLAGGSSNAAGALLAINKFFNDKLSQAELLELGASIGSDVPFCIQGGTCIGRGRGEILEQIKPNLTLHYCIVKPRKLSVSTPWAFKLYDESQQPEVPEMAPLVEALQTANLELVLNHLGNSFQEVIFKAHPELAELHKDLLQHGAWTCNMTGSGPTLFATVAGREQGHKIRRQILNDEDIGFVYGTEEIILEALPPIDFRLAESVDYGARIVSIE